MNKIVPTLQQLTFKPGRQSSEQKIIIQCYKFYDSPKQDRAAKPPMRAASGKKEV